MGVGFLTQQFRNIIRPFLPVVWVPIVYTILSSIGLILNFWTTGDMLHDEQFNKETDAGKEGYGWNSANTFDFIIIGAGSAGSVVANRLSKHYKVLLLEYGGEVNPLQFIPAFSVFFVNYPETDWMFRTVPQKYASLNSVNQRSSWSAGKSLGGSGTINLMAHLRGHKKDYDNWGRILNDPSWSWEGVLPHFKSYEDYEEGGDPDYHGFGGDLRVETPDYVGLGPEFVRAGQEFGYSNCDLNAPFNEGFDLVKYPIKYGIRQGTYKAFLEPIRRRQNLVIRKYAHVNRILTRDGNVAYGVEYDRHGVTRQAFASKEVILSAGTVNTAKLLMLSGIGPRHHLQEHNIPVISDLPVGLNLQDHVAAYMGPYFINKPATILLERDLLPSSFVQWFLGGRGILSTSGIHGTGIISSSLAKSRGDGDWPDIHFIQFGFSVFKYFADTFAHTFGLTSDEQHKFWDHAIGKETLLFGVSGARPFSRGFIKLGGKSPYDSPIIDPRYFTDPGDQDLLSIVEGVKVLNLLVENSTALGWDYGATYTTQRLPGCEHLTFRSDEYWECYVRRYTVTLHHFAGTASMGSVVDTQLRVHGVQNLRVMDNSVQPVIITTNTQASAIMIGEKGSAMLLKYWKEREEQEKLKTKYGPPNHQYGVPIQQYGDPPPELPPSNQYGTPPQNQYGAPPQNQYGAHPQNQYGAPPQNQDGAPAQNQYGAPPQDQYGAPPSDKYGPPYPDKNGVQPSDKYGAPPPDKYGAPPPDKYGAPPPDKYRAPSTKYGSTPSNQYRSPLPASSPQSTSSLPEPARFNTPPKALTYSSTSWHQKRSTNNQTKENNETPANNVLPNASIVSR